MNKDIQLLSFAFLFIFLSYNAVQQYVTAFYSGIGLVSLGFQSLILIYLFLTFFNPISAILVSKYGARRCMIFGSLFYTTYALSLLANSTALIYLTSGLLGIGASLLWTGQGVYLIKASNSKRYGANSGFFNSLLSLGSFVGVFGLGILIADFSFKVSFLLFSIFPIIGLVFLYNLNDRSGKQKTNYLVLIKKSVTSLTALKLSTLWFLLGSVFGLVIGIIPLEINKILGVSYIGILSSLFFIMPIIFSYIFGKISDIKRRNMMLIYSYAASILALFVLYLAHDFLILILGILLLAISYSSIRPLTFALVGDISTKENIEFLTALFLSVTNIGATLALLISSFLQTKTIYLMSIGSVVLSLLIFLPLLKLNTQEIRQVLSREIR